MKQHNIFLTFLPWIVFSAGLTTFFYSALIAMALTLILSRREIMNGFVLDIASVIFFACMAVLGLTLTHDNTFVQHPNLWSNVAMTAIMLGSVLINKPFTMQYADKGSIRLHRHLSIIWGVLMLIATLISLAHAYLGLSNMVGTVASVVAIYLGVKANTWYPTFYLKKLIDSSKATTKNDPFLKDNFAPILTEVVVDHLTVDGHIPSELSGVYMRNGPNPQFEPISYTYPIDGDGMLHAVEIKNGTASYRNRFVETKGLLAERRAGKAIYGGIRFPIPVEGEVDPIKDGAFIHIIRYAKQYLAMYEAGPAYEVTRDLKTVGEWAPKNASKPFPINAHTRFDAATNELFGITYDIQAPYLRYYVLDSEGALTQNHPIEKPYGTMMHDFALTQNYVVFFDCPAVFNAAALSGRGPILSWQPELGVKIGLLHRQTREITWIHTETFFVYHFANAFEQDNKVIVDYVRHEKFWLDTKEPSKPPMLYRATIDVNNKSVSHQQLYDQLVEFPRIRENLNAYPNRFIYCPSKPASSDNDRFTSLIKYDAQTRSTTAHDFGKNADISEAVFIPFEHSRSEDEGYLGLFVYDRAENQSDFVILNAQNITDKPIAKIKMPQRVPNGLHGSWMAD